MPPPTTAAAAAETMNFSGDCPIGPCLSSYIDKGSIESHRYYLATRTLFEMLRDRVTMYPTLNSLFKTSVPSTAIPPDVDRLRISASLRSDPSNKILVVFSEPGVVKLNVIRSIASQVVNKESLSRLILIVQNQITSQAKKAVESFSFKVELFQITDLLVNVTKHVLKPKHRVLTDEEKQRLLKKFNLDEKQLPRMLLKDAIAQYYGLEKGQVVKVTDSGEITESHITYRCVW